LRFQASRNLSKSGGSRKRSILKSSLYTEAVTDLRQFLEADPALDVTEARFQTIANFIPQLAWMARPDGYIVWYNQRWFDYTGTTLEQVEGWGWQNVHDPRALPEVLRSWQHSIATGKTFDMEFPLRGIDGVFRIFLTQAVPLRNQGQVIQWFGTSTDVSKLYEMEQALKESSETYRLAIKATNAAVWDLNLENGAVYWNDAFADAFGAPPNTSDCIDWWIDRIHPDDQDRTAQAFRIALAGQEIAWSSEYRFRRTDGLWANMSDRVSFSRNELGKAMRIVRALVDFTERKSIEERIVHLAALVEAAEDAIIFKTLDGIVRSWNQGAQRLFGYSAHEMIGQHIVLLFPPDQWEEEARIITRLKRGERIEPYETVRYHKEGRLIDVSVSISPILDGNGQIIGASKIARNITELKKKEAAMQLAHELQREQAKVLEMAQGFVRDMESRIVQWNLGANRLYGFCKEEALGQVSHDLFQTEFPLPLVEIEEVLHRTDLWEGDLVHRKKNGERLVVASQWVLHRNSAGTPMHILQVDTDITERTSAQKALELRNLDLQQFAYIASHDLKTPLRTISGFVELLQINYSERFDSQGKDWIRRVSEGAHRLEARIDNLLTYSRLDSRPEPFVTVNFQTVLEQTLDDLESLILETGAEITADKLPIVSGDPTQLVQVFQNLLGNGIKYRGVARPRIHISAKRVNGNWLFSVADNGIGIERQHHERVFDLFRRLHSQKAYPGDGIGLPLCRRIIGRHGGKIWIESEPEKGSTVFFTLSYQKEPNT
jgi:PAS domain S-box-containing protein